MGVRPGYKQTEVGVIPEEWNSVPMAELFAFQNGVNADKAAYGHGIPFINVLEVITYSTITESQIPGRISLSPQAANTFRVQHGDALFNRTSETQEEVGLASIYKGRSPVVFGGFVIRARPIHGRLDTQFAPYALRSPFVRRQIIAKGQGAVRANIGQQELSAVQVVLPPKQEQEAIAGALSDADALIESLEQLLAKKRNLKQGAMQELLTGKKRLPGFSGEWVVRELRTILQIPVTDGPHLTPKFLDDGIPFLSVNNLANNRIDWSDVRFVSKIDHLVFSKKCKPQLNDVLLGKAASVGKVALVENSIEFNIWSPIALLRVNNQNNPRFIYYALQSTHAIRRIELLTNLSSQGNIGMSDIGKLQLLLPQLNEQNAIASFLFDVDSDIDVCERRLVKARHLKQGMMQELLTGRIRLV